MNPPGRFNCDILYGSGDYDGSGDLARSRLSDDVRAAAHRRPRGRTNTSRKAGGDSHEEPKKIRQSEDPLLQYLDQPNPDTILIFDLEKFGARNQSPFRELVWKKPHVVEFPVMKEGEAAAWANAAPKPWPTPSHPTPRGS